MPPLASTPLPFFASLLLLVASPAASCFRRCFSCMPTDHHVTHATSFSKDCGLRGGGRVGKARRPAPQRSTDWENTLQVGQEGKTHSYQQFSAGAGYPASLPSRPCSRTITLSNPGRSIGSFAQHSLRVGCKDWAAAAGQTGVPGGAQHSSSLHTAGCMLYSSRITVGAPTSSACSRLASCLRLDGAAPEGSQAAAPLDVLRCESGWLSAGRQVADTRAVVGGWADC